MIVTLWSLEVVPIHHSIEVNQGNFSLTNKYTIMETVGSFEDFLGCTVSPSTGPENIPETWADPEVSSGTELDKKENLVLQKTDESSQLNISIENTHDTSQTREIAEVLPDTDTIEEIEKKNYLKCKKRCTRLLHILPKKLGAKSLQNFLI